MDSVELKLNVPHGERRSTLDALEVDLLDADASRSRQHGRQLEGSPEPGRGA